MATTTVSMTTVLEPLPINALRKRPRKTETAAPSGKRWRIRVGERAKNIRNPIREIMDTVSGKENPAKKLLSLAQGDPTSYPHLRPSTAMVDALQTAVGSGHFNGYQPSQGSLVCREAVARNFSAPGRPALQSKDVFMTFGCSEALSHCIAALAAPGSNMLLPRPGFPLYSVLCEYHGVEVRYYDLLPDCGWQCDIGGIAKLVDENTCALLLNNPSNPCGAVFTREHLVAVLSTAEELGLPVIADEVYADMSFSRPFVACAAATASIPILSVCALSKRWLAPGWRVGWIAVHDADGALAAAGVPETLLKLCQVSLGPAAPIQGAVPEIFSAAPSGCEWHTDILTALEASAQCCMRRCRSIPGLEVASEAQGAMYMMVRLKPNALDLGTDDVLLASKLLEEESVAILPGQCFAAPGFFRVVFAAPEKVLEEAWDRIETFCRRHSLKAS
ncbi:Tat [Symbiodinium pilosum]|uniref:Tat protein n=1 Tax=Symbiodinium pilosum TaxID=2952 RepID=A0A812RGK5_SYMPI|nr:Tat [Symbiodinium pilosum]